MQYQKSIKFLQGRKEEISTGAETSIIPWRISILWPSNQSHSIYTKDKSSMPTLLVFSPMPCVYGIDYALRLLNVNLTKK